MSRRRVQPVYPARNETARATFPLQRPRSYRAPWGWLLGIFLVGLLGRVAALAEPISPDHPAEGNRWEGKAVEAYLENDEHLYMALIDNMDAGGGYTLRGSPVLNEPWTVPEQYNHPLFYHPPGGAVWMWLFYHVAGNPGYACSALAAFALFYWSAVLLGWIVIRPRGRGMAVLLATGAAFSPIMAEVSARFWLDGPYLAFATAGAAVFLLAVSRQSRPLVSLAAVLVGCATLIKLTAVLAIPGMIALAWAITPVERRRWLAVSSCLLVVGTALIQSPWELWQWAAEGTPFPSWAGKPAAVLVQGNRYIHYITAVRSPWVYLSLVPRVIWTLVPSLVLLAAQWRDEFVRRRGVALVFWIAVVVAAHIALGALGYSKLLRYVVLVTPATVILFALVVQGPLAAVRRHRWGHGLEWGMVAPTLLVAFALSGLGLELAQSYKTSFVDVELSLIVPLTGMPD